MKIRLALNLESDMSIENLFSELNKALTELKNKKVGLRRKRILNGFNILSLGESIKSD